MKNLILILLITLIISAPVKLLADEEIGLNWPKEIVRKKTTVTLYQPQYDSFKENILEGRMALSITEKGKDPVFGALWFKSRLATDMDERTAILEKIDIERIHFPGVEDTSRVDQFTKLLIEEIESWDVVMSLDRITASLAEVEDLKGLSDNLNNSPPDIYFRTEPSVLVSIDGDPKLKAVEGADFEYVANTPFFIVKQKNKY